MDLCCVKKKTKTIVLMSRMENRKSDLWIKWCTIIFNYAGFWKTFKESNGVEVTGIGILKKVVKANSGQMVQQSRTVCNNIPIRLNKYSLQIVISHVHWLPKNVMNLRKGSFQNLFIETAVIHKLRNLYSSRSGWIFLHLKIQLYFTTAGQILCIFANSKRSSLRIYWRYFVFGDRIQISFKLAAAPDHVQNLGRLKINNNIYHWGNAAH